VAYNNRSLHAEGPFALMFNIINMPMLFITPYGSMGDI